MSLTKPGQALIVLYVLISTVVLADPPVASGVVITESEPHLTGYTIHGEFEYTDTDEDGEGVHEFQWYLATGSSGTGATAISGATSRSYTIQSSDAGYYIAFEVIPYDTTDESPGDPVRSAYELVNTVPVATAESYSGITEGGPVFNVDAVSGVLDNDSDADGHSLTADLVSGPFHEEDFTLNDDGSFSYLHNGSENHSDSFYYRASDGYEYSNTVYVSLSITPENDPPALSNLETGSMDFTEGYDPVNITNTISVSDDDNTNLSSATLTITTNFTSGEDELSYSPEVSGISGTYYSSSGVLDLEGIASVSAYEQALRNIRYQNTNTTNPSTASRAITFEVDDGTSTSNTPSRTITITAENDFPVLGGIEGENLNYTEGDPATDITGTLTVSDNDNTDLESATITITTNFTSGEDELSYSPEVSGILGTYYSSSGVLELGGIALVSAYEEALRNIRYENTNDYDPSTSGRAVTFIVNDGTDNSNPQTRTISITVENDAPVLSGLETGSLNFEEGGVPIDITATLTVDDDEANLESAAITITTNFTSGEDELSYSPTVSGISGTYYSSSGVLELEGIASVSAYEQALRNIRYQNTNTTNPSAASRIITFEVNDGTSNSNTPSRTITITAENDAPLLGDIEGEILNYTEGDPSTDITGTITVSDNDNTNLESATISITTNFTDGEDELSYSPEVSGISGTYYSSSGVMELEGIASVSAYEEALRNIRYENANDYDPSTFGRAVTFIVNDGTDNSNPQTRTISITVENDAPVLSGLETDSLNFEEGGVPIDITATLTVDDDEANLESAAITITTNFTSGEDELSYSPTVSGISGTYYSSSGVLELEGIASVSAYEQALRNIRYQNTNTTNPSSASRVITFEVNDGTSTSNTPSRTITITAENDAPLLGDIEGENLNYTEGDPATEITGTITVSDNDNTNLESATISITTNFTEGEDELSYSPTVSGISGTYYSSSGVFELEGIAPVSAYQEALRNIRYRNSNALNPSTNNRTVTCVVDDGTAASNSVFRMIDIISENDPPVAGDVVITDDGTPAIDETLTGSYTYTDPEENPEGASTYRWYRANSSGGPGATQLTGAIDKTYTTVFDDNGKFLQFRVTPYDDIGDPGTEVSSEWKYINAVPVVTNLSVSGTFTPGNMVTAVFDYEDSDTDPEGIHTYQWYRADDIQGTGSVSISGAMNSAYTITEEDYNHWISYIITPVAQTGSSPGEPAESDWVPVTELPTAVISDDDTICVGEQGYLTITLTGDSPWDVVYTVNETSSKINNINSSPYTLSGFAEGKYILDSVYDNRGYSGIVSGVGTITHYETPTASIGGNISTCAGITDSIAVALTGEAPWTYTYAFNGETESKSGILTSPNYIYLSSSEESTYTLTEVSDANCPGNVSGTVNVSVVTSPTAILTGDAQICPGSDTTITIALEGEAPYSVVYTFNGTRQPKIDTDEDEIVIPVDKIGRYALVSIKDNTGKGCVSGLANISYHEVPTAAISGNQNFCEGAPAVVPVNLTGNPRFTFIYSLDSGTPDTIRNIYQTTYNLKVYPQNNSSLILMGVKDQYCPGEVTGTLNFTELKAPGVSITNLEDLYSSDVKQIVFNYNPAGGDFYDSDASAIVLDQGNKSAIFSPAISGSENSPHKVVYKYRGENGCWGRDSVIVSVLDSLGQIDITSTKKDMYCYNDPIITLRGVNIEQNTGTFSIEGNKGLTPTGTNTAIVDPSVIKSGIRTVTYHFEAGGSQEEAMLELNFEELHSNFRWDNECFNGESIVNFEGLGQGDSDLEEFYWDFYFPDTTITHNEEHTIYTFDRIGTYQVDYIIESEYGCRDTATKIFTLRPTTIIEENEPYDENFEKNAGQWIKGTLGAGGANSWTLGVPENSVIHTTDGNEAWYTKIENRSQAENSVVVSPCFSFENLDRPMIKMNIWRAFDQHRDGAVLQYSLNDGNSWRNIGQLEDGIEWYNSYQIQGVPGGQPVGWSEAIDNRWIEARHDLNLLAGKPSVRLRVAYGSDGTGIINEGFAFDNVSISNRKKQVLLEHFTNSGDTMSKNANHTVNGLVNSMTLDIIDVQYHMAFPGDDPFYDQNPGISDSREIYYNVEDVPFGLIDGGRGKKSLYSFNYSDKDLTEIDLKKAVLEDLVVDIDLQAAQTNDAIVIETGITSLDTISQRIITLHHIVIERLIKDEVGNNGETRFESVAKDMIPNTFGTDFDRSWLPGESETVSFIWPYTNVYDEDELRVVAFVQDEETKRIYQAGISFLDDDIDDIKEYTDNDGSSYTIYPNPSDGKVWIKFDEVISDNLRIEVFDNSSRLIYREDRGGLINAVFLSLDHLKPGVYILKISSRNDMYVTDKLVIAKGS